MITVSGVTISGSTRYFVLKCTKGEKWCPTFVLVAGKQLGLLHCAALAALSSTFRLGHLHK